jgi:Actinobacteria/chloroflexi VLRF1 release factor
MVTPMTAGGVNARRVSVPVERLARWLDGFTERHGATVVEADSTEVRLTGADGARAWLVVPFPPLPALASGEDPRAVLIAHTAQRRTVGVLLVRRRGHAVGVFDGSDLVAAKVDSAYVQGTTRAGGWSQQRYARRRANQARAAFTDAADTAARILLPHAGQLDAVICGGDRVAVDAVVADPRLRSLTDLRCGPFLTVPDPKLRILQATPEQFRAAQITLEP